MTANITRLLDQIDRQSIEARRYPESAQFEELLEHTGQLSQAVRAVLGVLDDYPMPGMLHDPTGITGAELETLEGYIREAIQEVLGDDDA